MSSCPHIGPSWIRALSYVTNTLWSFDAIHLASGLQLRETLQDEMSELALIYVTGDDLLSTAAEAEGLVVDNPFWHTELNTHHQA